MTRTRSAARARRGWAVLAWLAVLPFLAVFGYMLLVALQHPLDVTAGSLVPTRGLTLNNFTEVLSSGRFLGYIGNSLIIGIGATIVSVALGVPAAFALAVGQMQRTGVFVLLVRMIPGIALVVPWFILATQLDLIDTHLGLTLSHIVVTLPFVIWMMMPFFEELPVELREAAVIDGSSTSRFLLLIALPLVRTGLVAAAILAFVFSWNQFMFAVVLAGRRTETVPVAVFSFLSYGSTNWGQIAAAAFLITLPVVVVSLLVQRWIVEGLTAGAVKG